MSKNKRYYYLQLKDDFFTDKTIKRLRKISGGDTYTIIYLKMLLLSLENEGKLFYDGVETDFAKELALTIDESEDDLAVTINYLMSQSLMEEIIENDEYYLTEIPSMIGSETASTRRSRKSRQNKALQCNTNATPLQHQATLSNIKQHQRNGEIDIDIDIEKDIELEKEIEIDIDQGGKKVKKQNNIERIIEKWNSVFGNINKVVAIIKGTERYTNYIYLQKTFGMENIEKAIDNIADSSYLTGKVNDFVITFDWFLETKNFINVLENKYKDHNIKQNSKNKFNNYNGQSNSYTTEQLNDIAKELTKQRNFDRVQNNENQ